MNPVRTLMKRVLPVGDMENISNSSLSGDYYRDIIELIGVDSDWFLRSDIERARPTFYRILPVAIARADFG